MTEYLFLDAMAGQESQRKARMEREAHGHLSLDGGAITISRSRDMARFLRLIRRDDDATQRNSNTKYLCDTAFSQSPMAACHSTASAAATGLHDGHEKNKQQAQARAE
jgi:hypothetical protein